MSDVGLTGEWNVAENSSPTRGAGARGGRRTTKWSDRSVISARGGTRKEHAGPNIPDLQRLAA